MSTTVLAISALWAIIIIICAIACTAHLAAIDEYTNKIREYIMYDVKMRYKDAFEEAAKKKK